MIAREPDAEQVDLSLSNEGLSLTLLDVELSPKVCSIVYISL